MNLRGMAGRYTSNEVTHFMGRAVADCDDRYKLFCKIVLEGGLQPSSSNYEVGFSGHSDGPKPLSSNEAIKTPFVSFCGIPAATLRVHMVKYGPFGIAFAKRFLVSMGQRRFRTSRLMPDIEA